MRAPEAGRSCSKLLSPINGDNTRVIRVFM